MDIATSTSAGTGANAPSPHGPTLYARFPRSFGFEFAAIVFLCPPLVVLWFFVAGYYYFSGAISIPILKAAAYYSAVFVFTLLLYGNGRATNRARGVVIDGDRIVKKGIFGIAELRCGEATGVRCTKNPLFNRRMAIKSAKGGISLPLGVRDGPKMVAAVFEMLTANGLFRGGEVEAAAAKRRLCGLAIRYGALYRLRGKYMRKFIAAAAAAAAINITTAMIYWERDLLIALAWGLGGMMFQTLAYLAAEKIWARKLPASMEAANGANICGGDAGGIDDSFDAIHTASAVAAVIVGMAAGIAVTFPA